MYPQPQDNPNAYPQGYHAYNQPPVPGKTHFGLALAAGLSGALGVVLSLLIFGIMVSGNSEDSILGWDSHGISLFATAMLIVIGSLLALVGIISNKARTACIVILGIMGLPTMIALWLITVFIFTILGIG